MDLAGGLDANGPDRSGRQKLDQLLAREPVGALELPHDLDETWEALQVVTPKQRTALVLRFYADLSVAEVADLMGERPGTVKSLVHRGLSVLGRAGLLRSVRLGRG